MWTLLRALGSPGRAKDAEPEPDEPAPLRNHSSNGASAADATRVANRANVANGTPASLGAGHVRIFMCPGYAEVGQMGLRQAAVQFDLAGARRFHSLAEAERACARKTGFLLEIEERSGEARVLFVEGLRG